MGRGRKRLTTEAFIEKARMVHEGKYQYSKVQYTHSDNKILITCPTHGDWEQKAGNHISGKGCPACATGFRGPYNKLDAKGFIKKAQEVHENLYNYDKTYYRTSTEKVTITCNKHGDYHQLPGEHLRGLGCFVCYKEEDLIKRVESFIKRSKVIHEGYYEYSKVSYVNLATEVSIICPQHGDYLQTPTNHLTGTGCPLCREEIKIEKGRVKALVQYITPRLYDLYVTPRCSINGVTIQSYHEAVREGLDRYFTGYPCRRGHISERLVTSHGCTECTSEDAQRKKTWCLENKEAIKAKSAVWYSDPINRAKSLAAATQWQKDNPDRVNMRQRGRRRKVVLATPPWVDEKVWGGYRRDL